MITVPVEWWTLIVATILPAIVAAVRSRYASSRWGALLLVGLTVLTALAAEIGSTFDLGAAAERFVILFVVAVVAHYGLLRPAGLTGSEGAIAQAIPGGLGADTKGVLVCAGEIGTLTSSDADIGGEITVNGQRINSQTGEPYDGRHER